MIRKTLLRGIKKVTTVVLAAVIAMQGNLLVKAEDRMEENTQIYDISSWLSEDGNYVYPITPSNPEWKEMEDYLDKVEACKIPQEILKNLSNEQLMQAIIDYPLIYDVFFFSDVNEGVEHLAKTCDAFAELLEREEAKDILFDTIMSKAANDSIKTAAENGENDSEPIVRTAREEIVFDTLVAITIFQEKIGSELSEEELVKLADVSAMVDMYAQIQEMETSPYSVDIIRTPNGSIVWYGLVECYHFADPDWHRRKDLEMVNTYGVTLVSGGNCSYNCHSYAWYSQSPDNKYWINDPSPYMQDGSYSRIGGGNINSSALSVKSGDIIVYGGLSHSAIVVGDGGGEPFATRMMISKWGAFGVFMHRGSQVPRNEDGTFGYDLDEISAWRRN